MSKRLENKNIVVTAAGQGIGRATAIAFHNEGANVIATDINDKTLKTLNKEYPNIKEHKKIDIFINNAGISGPNTKVWNYPIDEWHKVIDLDLNAVFYCCKAKKLFSREVLWYGRKDGKFFHTVNNLSV